MTKEDEYRQNAADTVQLAQRASSSSDKGRLLRLAEAWLDLAERAHTMAPNLRRPTIPHPGPTEDGPTPRLTTVIAAKASARKSSIQLPS
jgi:hypothetical protein